MTRRKNQSNAQILQIINTKKKLIYMNIYLEVPNREGGGHIYFIRNCLYLIMSPALFFFVWIHSRLHPVHTRLRQLLFQREKRP